MAYHRDERWGALSYSVVHRHRHRPMRCQDPRPGDDAGPGTQPLGTGPSDHCAPRLFRARLT
eukprot:135926-Hanusia_phi.AAC.1